MKCLHQQSEFPQFLAENSTLSLVQMPQRQSAGTTGEAHEIEGVLDGDGVDIGEQRTDERQNTQLQPAAFRDVFSAEESADVVGLLGQHVAQHGNDALPSQTEIGQVWSSLPE